MPLVFPARLFIGLLQFVGRKIRVEEGFAAFSFGINSKERIPEHWPFVLKSKG